MSAGKLTRIRALRVWLDRFGHLSMSETHRFLTLSIFIGIFAGLLVVCFHIAIDFVSWNSLGALAGRYRFGRLIAPTAGAAIAAILVLRFFPLARGSGVNQTKAAVYVSDGFVPWSTVAGKFLACSIAIGSGNSLGPEDPSLQMGAGIASLLGRLFGLQRETMRLIAPVGAAAGIAAAFNTPITGVLFVMEEVLAGWNAAVLGSIVLAAVAAVVVTRWFLGNAPIFRVPAFELTHPSELLVYAAIGAVSGLLSALFIRLIRTLHQRFEKLPQWRVYALPVCAGFFVGAVGLWFPEVMGAGYDAINNALHGRFTWQLLLCLGIAKLVVTLFCFSSGTPGGMFAPALFVGAMIGGGFGGLAHRFWPFPSSSSEAYVLVGMGTFFAGVFRAPMTSIFMVFEVSASYVIILPVMIANMVSYFLSRQLQPVPFFTMLARQEGVDLPSGEEKRAQPALLVEDAMRPVQPDTWDGKTPHLYPDLPLDAAMRLLGSHRTLPVVSRAHPDALLGVLTLEDVHRAYGIEEHQPNSSSALT